MKQQTLRRIAASGLSALLPAVTLTALPPMTAAAAGSVVINEVCTKNSTAAAADGQFYDYVELYNTGSSAVSLAGYGLTDDAAKPYAYTFPSGASIPAKGFLTVWCGVNEGTDGAAFGLSKNGETLTLTDAGGNQAAQLEVPGLADDTAYGRLPDGSDTFAILSRLTPNAANPTDATQKIAVETPVFSKDSGFYASGFQLTLSAPQGCTIYYTTDGSDPTTASERYSGAIQVYDKSDEENVYAAKTGISNGYTPPSEPVDKAMIVRAIAVDAQGNISNIATKSYFIGYTNSDFVTQMRVISLVTDPDNLFDYEKGIYVYGKVYDDWKSSPEYSPMAREWEQPANFTQSGKAWERPAHITVFESGTATYSTDVGIRIHGGATRTASQKSFNLYARADYGDTRIRYDFFNGELKNTKGKVIDTFEKLTLRNGGNDSTTKIRDRLNQEAVSDRAYGTQAQTECVVFLDGEFWGAYNIVEKIGKEYISDHYKVKEDTVCMIKNDELSDGSDQGLADYESLKALANTDFSSKAAYENFCKLVDAESYAQYMATELIVGNSDFGDNNYALWKTETVDSSKQYADGKWRFILFDTEYGQGLYGQSNANTNTFQTLRQKNKWITNLLFKLLEGSEEFRQLFVTRYFDLCNENFSSEKMTAALSKLSDAYLTIDAETSKRFSSGGGSWGGWGGFDWGNFGPGQPGQQPGGPGQNPGHQTDYTQSVRSEIQTINSFWQSRAANAKQQLVSFLSGKISSQMCTVTVENSASQGTVLLNSLALDCANGKWSGTYPADCVLTIQAQPKDGYVFSSWNLTGTESTSFTSGSSTSDIAQITLSGESSVTIQPVYQTGSAPTIDSASVKKLLAYLTKTGTLTVQEAAVYDLDRSGTLNGKDLTLMKAQLLKK